MMAKRKPDDIVNMKVRFTEALRARIEQEAKKNNRSINGEIVYRLGTTFGPEGLALANQFEQIQKEATIHLRKIVEDFIRQQKKG
jgi:hypothetical protein